ncbi:hypothetical protein AB0L75_42265 [Streptomyces sp. NPDC052101]|uniref:hypothetical protein n=1 Tax=Streptomyces sp. NPDC052101 TaxID=3155763 RepID=UPI00341DFBFB
MPQRSAGCAGVRKPALALLVGLVLMLLAHAVACAAHGAGEHEHGMTAVASAMYQEAGAASTLRPVGEAADCALTHGPDGSDGHTGHDTACCDPADWPAGTRATAGTLLLAFTLIALLSLRHRTLGPVMPGSPPGGGDRAAVPAPDGAHLLRLVCVSRT